MTRNKLVDLLRRSRASLDSILGLHGFEDPSFREAVRLEAEVLAGDIHVSLLDERDPGGPRVRSSIGDEVPVSLRADLCARLDEFESEFGRPLRVPTDPESARTDLRRSVLDSILYSFATGDLRLASILGALLVDLDEQGRTK